MSPQKSVLLLFDVDGTLTKPRQEVAPEMTKFLSRLREHASIAIVGGSDMPKITEQLANGCKGTLLKMFDYVFAENGLVAFKGGAEIGRANLVSHLGDEFLQRFINFTLRYLSTIELPLKRGNFIEFRNGMMNVCPIGRSCSQQEREMFVEFDSKHGVRQKLVHALQAEFADANLCICIGGQISVDVFPQGWDKTYSLKFLDEAGFEEIHFFGDRTAPGGNDHAIYMDPRTVGHAVSDPSDTQRQVEELMSL